MGICYTTFRGTTLIWGPTASISFWLAPGQLRLKLLAQQLWPYPLCASQVHTSSVPAAPKLLSLTSTWRTVSHSSEEKTHKLTAPV